MEQSKSNEDDYEESDEMSPIQSKRYEDTLETVNDLNLTNTTSKSINHHKLERSITQDDIDQGLRPKPKQQRSEWLQRKGKSLHITLQGHHDIDFTPIINNINFFARCHELGDINKTPHTHYVIGTDGPTMVRPVYQYLVTKDFDPDQISIITAKTIEYAFNYHTGRGKKPRCTDFRVTTPKDYDEEEYILTHFRDKHDHKSRKRTNKQRAEENKLTDEHNDQSLLDEGLFTKRQLHGIRKAEKYLEQRKVELEDQYKPIIPKTGVLEPIPWNDELRSIALVPDPEIKQRNIYIWSKIINAGKSRIIKLLQSKYRTKPLQPNINYTTILPTTQIITMDGISEPLKWEPIEQLLEGTNAIRAIGEAPTSTPPGLILVITSNEPIEEIFKDKFTKGGSDVVYGRFDVYELTKPCNDKLTKEQSKLKSEYIKQSPIHTNLSRQILEQQQRNQTNLVIQQSKREYQSQYKPMQLQPTVIDEEYDWISHQTIQTLKQ